VAVEVLALLVKTHLLRLTLEMVVQELVHLSLVQLFQGLAVVVVACSVMERPVLLLLEVVLEELNLRQLQMEH
jgi:hypothetical protein